MPVSTSNVAPVHGGLDKPVNRIVEKADPEWSKLATIEVNEIDQTTLYRIADGTLSPLNGPMTEADMKNVLAKAAIERNGEWWAWGIPIVLPVSDEEAENCKIGDALALVRDGVVFGTIKVRSVYDWDKEEFVQGVYGTERTDHPGARLWTEDARTKLVGGEIHLVPFVDERSFADRVMSPVQTRKVIEEKGWEQSIAFQTRNPLHRAHEYALVYGAEVILRETGRRTGVVLHPLVGQLKGDDVPAETRMKTYVRLVDEHFLGQGDKDEELWKEKGQNFDDAVALVGLDMRMYYGGPREAIQHAIYRQNCGFTHFIIGRKHADAPYDDKTPIWGDFDAQEVFEKLEGKLAIKTVNVGFAAFFEELGHVGLVKENEGKTVVNISGTKMREILGAGELPDERVMRPSTAEILAEYYSHKNS
jgi:sulfate adenylyltransferase